MIAIRERLPDRREAETFDSEAGGIRYCATVGRYPDGRIGELFINTGSKPGSAAGIAAAGSAIVTSIALQAGVGIDVIRRALNRDASGEPSGPLAALLDRIAEESGSEP
jgi:hypothetical protein